MRRDNARTAFFDTILQRKEYFSPYIFEDTAEKMLEDDASLKREFEARKNADDEFAKSRQQQLAFLYERSVHQEKAHMRYPIYRIPNKNK